MRVYFLKFFMLIWIKFDIEKGLMGVENRLNCLRIQSDWSYFLFLSLLYCRHFQLVKQHFFQIRNRLPINQITLMQENSATTGSQLPNSITPNTSVVTPTNPESDFFQKFTQSTGSAPSAFSLFKTVSVKQNSDSSHFQSEDDWMERRKKRGCYRKYTVEEKEQAVKKIMLGYDVKEISKQYHIPRRNLLRWKKNGCQRKQGGGRPTDGQLQRMLYEKILSKNLKGEREIREQAKRLSKSDNFKASKGWYCKFNKRFTNFNSKNLSQKEQLQNNQSGQYQNL